MFRALLGLEAFSLPISTEELIQAGRLPELQTSPVRWTTPPRARGGRGTDLLLVRLRWPADQNLEAWVVELVPTLRTSALYVMVPEPSPYVYNCVLGEGEVATGFQTPSLPEQRLAPLKPPDPIQGRKKPEALLPKNS